jgi:hypothetical protein
MMRRSLTLLLLFVGSSGCKSNMQQAIELVPDSATVIGGMDVAALRQSKVFGGAIAQFVAPLDLGKQCELGLDAWRTIVFGFDPEDYASTFVMVLSADGIGTKTKLDCIRNLAAQSLGTEPWTQHEVDGRVMLDIDFGGDSAKGYVVDGNRLVIGSDAQSDAISALIAGEGTAAVSGGLKDLMGRADPRQPMWVAGKVPAHLPPGAPIVGARDVVASVGLATGVTFSASIAYENAADASARSEALRAQVDEIGASATELGIPSKVIDRVEVSTTDALLEISARISDEEMKAALGGLSGSLR